MSLKNFKRPENEEPYYYSSTIEKGKIIKHDGDPDHAVYKSEMREITRRANLWHEWVSRNVPKAYDNIGAIKSEVYSKYRDINRQFIDGERSE